jgi:hypothetical protein
MNSECSHCKYSAVCLPIGYEKLHTLFDETSKTFRAYQELAYSVPERCHLFHYEKLRKTGREFLF